MPTADEERRAKLLRKKAKDKVTLLTAVKRRAYVPTCGSRYMPHQGERERTRRRLAMTSGKAL